MDRLRRSLRQSFRRRSSKEGADDPSKPHQWQKDEAAVRAGTCSFTVKYLGCVEVYESRGMQVCEEALKVLRNSRRRTIKGVLYVSGDGLRVVDADNKGLIVDQTIEKVSFCAPDRNHEKGFAYICRDGTTRRWMCHGFVASKDSGERLSHAVGCAFAVCLEHKQKRDREAQIIAQIQPPAVVPTSVQHTLSQPSQSSSVSSSAVGSAASTTTATNLYGSFRRASLQERKQDPQNVIPAEKPPVKTTEHPNAVARPTANRSLFERQGSLRMPSSAVAGATSTTTNAANKQQDSFHRFNSLRLNQLPSNLARQQQQQQQSGHSSNNAGVGAIWEGEEATTTSSNTDLSLSQQLSTAATISCRTNGFDSPSRSSGHPSSSQWDKSFTENNFSSTTNSETNWSPASSTMTTATTKSKGDEWLQIAANQAKLLQQYNRQTPPNMMNTAGGSSFNSSPAPVGSSDSSPQHWAAYSNAVEFFPPTPARQQLQQQYGNNGVGPPPARSAHHPANVVAWHQSVSFDVADAERNNFDDKWAMLEESDKRRHSTSMGSSNVTNPFTQESSAVKI